MSAFWGSSSAKQTTADTDTAAPAPAAASLSSTLSAAGAVGASSDAVDQILQSAYNAQYLQASVQLDALEALMDPDNAVFCGDIEERRLREKLSLHTRAVAQIRHRTAKILHTMKQEEAMGTAGSEWIYGIKYFGITTHYQLADDGCITDDLPFFEQAAVIHDINNFKNWVPCCDDSRLLEKLAPAELLMYLSIRVPLAMSRDACLHAYGADCLHEKGCILLIGNSVEHVVGEEKMGGGEGASSSSFPSARKNAAGAGAEAGTLPMSSVEYGENSVMRKVISHCVQTACPWRTKGWGQDRMNITEYTAIIEITGPESARPVIIAKVDPNAGRYMPQWILNFLIKNMAGIMLHTFQKQVQRTARYNKLSAATKKTKKQLGTSGEESINANRGFYRDWLLPKIREFARFKGWEMDDIACLGEDGKMPSSSSAAAAAAGGGGGGAGGAEEVEEDRDDADSDVSTVDDNEA